MLYRKVIKEFENWKANENTALLVKGARQVGKTKIIEEFIKSFDNYIEIDFTKDSEALTLLLEVRNYDEFVSRLSLLSQTNIINNSGVLFLDEIQYYYEVRADRISRDPSFREKYIDIVTLSKEIAEKGEFRLIISGSMLGVTIFSINHNPTGYLKEITMYPMDFEEFLLANGVSQRIISEVEGYFNKKEAVPETLNEMLLNKFNEYLFVGGYPAAVQAYVNSKNMNQVNGALETIDNWYRQDIIKYAAKEDKIVILEMYSLLASEISKKNKKFIKSHMDVKNFKNIDLTDRFLWLKNAGIAIPTYNVTNAIYPLEISKDNKIIKLFMGDVGLLTSKLFDVEARKKYIIDSSEIDLGAITENAVSQLLVAHGYNSYFQSTKKHGEIDFLIESNMNIIPIEVKSGEPNKKTDLYNHAALNNLLEAHKEIKESWVFGKCNVKRENDVIFTFPLYMVEFVRK